MVYHHGDLPGELLAAVDEIIATQGLHALSLRAVARHANVSHGAPAHHFGDKRGLLTAFALQGAQYLEGCVRQALAQVDADDHPGRLTAVGMGYVDFALAHTAHFRVTFREELLDMEDVALQQAREAAGLTLDEVLGDARSAGWLAAARYDAVRLSSWSLAHGFSSLAVANAFAPASEEVVRNMAQAAFDSFTMRVLAPLDA